MAETEECKECRYCENFRFLYKRADFQFIPYKLGECYLSRKLMQKGDCCGRWQKRQEQNAITPDVLKNAIKNLEEMKIILLAETERIKKK